VCGQVQEQAAQLAVCFTLLSSCQIFSNFMHSCTQRTLVRFIWCSSQWLCFLAAADQLLFVAAQRLVSELQPLLDTLQAASGITAFYCIALHFAASALQFECPAIKATLHCMYMACHRRTDRSRHRKAQMDAGVDYELSFHR
jgi:hypothetical protein